MKKLSGKNLLVLVLVASFLATAVLHVLFMNEMMVASQTCFNGIVQTQDCHQPEGIICCAAEATTLQIFLQALPHQLTKIIISAPVAASAIPFLLLILLYKSSLLVAFQSWLNILRRRILAFHHQIGSWLELLEKRDPTHNSLWRGFEFAMIPII